MLLLLINAHQRYLKEEKDKTRHSCTSLPSAPKSGLNDFFSLKFLNNFTLLDPSRTAYLNKDHKF